MNAEEARALASVGKFAVLANNMNVEALEEYLSKPIPDFDYQKLCEETIKFVRAVRKLKLEDAYTIS